MCIGKRIRITFSSLLTVNAFEVRNGDLGIITGIRPEHRNGQMIFEVHMSGGGTILVPANAMAFDI